MTLSKMRVILLALLLAAMAMIPMVSAAQDQGRPVDSMKTVGDIPAPVPYANIYLYGPNTASINQEFNIYTSGQIGNSAGTYCQRFYIENLDTSTVDGVNYITTPTDWTPISHSWQKWSPLTLQEHFSSVWTVKLSQKGTYEVVASVFGAPVTISDQKRMIITVS